MSTPTQGKTLELSRCPYCAIDRPNLERITYTDTKDDRNLNHRAWYFYKCARCGGVIMTYSPYGNTYVSKIYPEVDYLDDELPSKVKYYLQQAIDSVSAPAASVVVSASAVDAMLKDKGYSTGSLYSRIEKAVTDGLLTREMSTWAHQVRLDANDQRHVDSEAVLPTTDDAKRAIEFVKTIGEFVYALPAKVTRGIQTTSSQTPPSAAV